MIEILKKYMEIFVNAPGKVKRFLGHKEVKSGKPAVQKSYPVLFNKRKLKKDIKRMLRKDIIKHSNSPYSIYI